MTTTCMEEQSFRVLFDDIPVACHEIDREGVIQRVNRAECALLGFEPAQVLGKPVCDLVAPEQREACRAAIRRKLDGRQPIVPFQREYVGRDGRRHTLEIHETLLHDDTGSVVGIRSFLLDVSGRVEVEKALRASEERYRDLFENANDLIFTVDLTGRFTELNKAGEQITGYNRNEKLHICEIMAPDQADLARRMFERKIATKQPTYYELTIRAKDGHPIPLELSTRLILKDGKPVGVQGIARDMTDRKRAEEALRESEERYALAVRGANDGLWDWNLTTGKIYFSPRWKAMLGYEENEISDDPEEWFRRVHPDDLGRLKVDLGLHLEGCHPHVDTDCRIQHRDGAYLWMRTRGVAVHNGGTKASRMAGSQTDVTMRKLHEERLLRGAFYDELTGLPNRSLFMERLERAALRALRRSNCVFAVLFLDLDRFKVINDSLGHMIGDQLLIGIARRLQACLRPEDTVARLGGDEFVILCDDLSSPDDASHLAERIQRELQLPFNLCDTEVFTSASIGIALSSTGYQSAEDLLRDADTVMYRAKALGKARHEVFHQGLHARAVERLHLETDLRRAIERREFLLHYQPIICRESGEIAAVEALVRWQHPQRGLIYPQHFIAAAEDTGIIVPLGEWVLEAACEQNKAWQAAGFPAMRVAVNLSPRQFKQPNLVESIMQALENTRLDARFLDLEITENMVLNSSPATVETLQQLCALGIRISIDDFGMGYSSLKYLRRFPISTLKIAEAFVHDIDIDPEGAAIAAAVINLGRSLKLNVVAEGVETPEQLEFLCERGCSQIQGYIFSPPAPAEQITALLRKRYLSPAKAVQHLESAVARAEAAVPQLS